MIWAYHVSLGCNRFYDKQTLKKLSDIDRCERDFLYFDEKTFDTVIRYLADNGATHVVIDLGEGVCYDCAPELAVHGSLSKEKVAEKLAWIRSLGLTPIPKLDFSAAHDVWLGAYGRMLDTDEYRAFVTALIREVCELFGNPPYFHLGLADETWEAQKYYAFVCVRGREGFWHDARTMFDACRACGARAIVSGDYFYREPEIFAANLPSDVIVTAEYKGVFFKEGHYHDSKKSEAQEKFEALIALPNDMLYAADGLTMFYMNALAGYAKENPRENCLGLYTECGEPCVSRVEMFLLNDAERLCAARRLYEAEK